MNKFKEFWNNHKDTIKNITIVVSVPLAVVALIGVNRMNKVVEDNGLNDLFYGDEEETTEGSLDDLIALEEVIIEEA